MDLIEVACRGLHAGRELGYVHVPRLDLGVDLQGTCDRTAQVHGIDSKKGDVLRFQGDVRTVTGAVAAHAVKSTIMRRDHDSRTIVTAA